MEIKDCVTEDKQGLFTIYDSKADTGCPIIDTTNGGLAQYLNVLVNTHSEMPQHKHPEDFIIFKVGECFEGNIKVFETKQIAGSLNHYKKPCYICKKEEEKNGKE